MDGLNKLIDAVENKISELEGAESPIQSSRKISSSQRILSRLMNDPDVELGDPNDEGERDICYKGDCIGTINSSRTINWNNSEQALMFTSKINAAEDITRADLESSIKDELDSDVCTEIINLAFSEDNMFEDDVFTETEEFCNMYLSSEDARDVAKRFYNGEDLDDGGSANPEKDYLRFNSDDNIESTDYPGDVYFDTLFDEILDYIMDHLEDREFPDNIQELIDEYLKDKEA